MLTLLLWIIAGVAIFVILGLLGWGVRLLGLIGSFLGEGIVGCLGCFFRFIWVILVILITLALIF